jgi:aspartate-semialdehyde dehydrogenase
MKIAVVGATGLVGSKMLQVLDEQKVQIDELIVAASERSVGKEIVFQGKTYKVVSVDDAIAAVWGAFAVLFAAAVFTGVEVVAQVAFFPFGNLRDAVAAANRERFTIA